MKDNFNTHKWFKNQYLGEAHETTTEGQMKYIKGALKNLTKKDLQKVYDMVEDLDPKYENK
jgi:hypothetical protein